MAISLTQIGKRLLELRKKKGLTQTEVAQYMNKSNFAYSNYENGKRCISIEDLCKLSALFGVSIDEIVGNTVTYNRQKAISFPTYDSTGLNEPTLINTERDDLILFKINEFETEYYLKVNNIIFNEKVLVNLDASTFPALVSRSDEPSGYFITNLLTKETKFYNNTAFKSSIIILGRYAGKIDKEINIPDFL